MPLKIYLAGPEVFLPNAREMLDRKAAMARAAGFTPLSPGDLKVEKRATMRDFAFAISEVNERMMIEADAIIANLTPWRGISADVGTVYELGFMCALDKIAYAYTNVGKRHFERVADYYHGRHARDASGTPRGPDGLAMEDYELHDNLMLPAGAERRGGKVVIGNAPPDAVYTDTTAFAACLRHIAEHRT
jgi:nucleoside 2-deoxyribosyltransferase